MQKPERNQVRHLHDSNGALHATGKNERVAAVAERAFVMHQQTRINVAFNDKVGLGKKVFYSLFFFSSSHP
ncbi:MAG: hypothetical protein O2854_06375 [Chloroflexi bacterium]|nr:hypothetical protein [Chloroflexota bacterium]